MESSNSKADFEDKITTFLSTESVAPKKNCFNDNLHEIGSPYSSSENFKIFSKQLHEKTFPICHHNIRSLSKNIDKLKELLPSLNGSFIVVVATETLCGETTNMNSLLEIPNYSALDKTKQTNKKNRKGSGICTYVQKSLKCSIRDVTDIFNESVETLPIGILKKSYEILQLQPPTVPTQEITNYLRNFAKTF